MVGEILEFNFVIERHFLRPDGFAGRFGGYCLEARIMKVKVFVKEAFLNVADITNFVGNL